jgi:transcriptional regulator with XRE-family HTH domain
MKRFRQNELARAASISGAYLSQLKSGVRDASPLVADRLAGLTGTDIRLWFLGSRIDERRVAIEAWGTEESVSAPN